MCQLAKWVHIPLKRVLKKSHFRLSAVSSYMEKDDWPLSIYSALIQVTLLLNREK